MYVGIHRKISDLKKKFELRLIFIENVYDIKRIFKRYLVYYFGSVQCSIHMSIPTPVWIPV